MKQAPPNDLVLAEAGATAETGSAGLTFIGTATALIHYGGFSILTDPNFLHRGDRAPLGYGLSATRLTDPALELEELPPIDFVVLSHHHGDHFDPVVVERLQKDLPILTEPHSARKLARQGFQRPVALDTWQSITVRREQNWVRVTALPAKHAPQPLKTLLPNVMGSMLEFGTGDGPVVMRLYITGDTLYHSRLQEIRDRYPDVDLCVIHLGGTRIAGVLLTMDAAQGVRTLRVIQPKVAIPVHYDDYDVFKSPLSDFRALVDAAGLTTTMRYLDRGETYSFDAD